MLQEKIGIIGAGKIGSAIVRGIIGAGLATKDQVMASDVSEALAAVHCRRSRHRSHCRTTDKVCDFADIVILAVKPQIVDSVLEEVAKKTGQSQTFDLGCRGCASFPARGSIWLKGARVVRVMPNIPCVVGAGASGYAGGAHATAKDMEKVGLILNSFGIGLACGRKIFGCGDRTQR